MHAGLFLSMPCSVTGEIFLLNHNGHNEPWWGLGIINDFAQVHNTDLHFSLNSPTITLMNDEPCILIHNLLFFMCGVLCQYLLSYNHLYFSKVYIHLVDITLLIDRYHCSYAAMIPVKYECDLKKSNKYFQKQKGLQRKNIQHKFNSSYHWSVVLETIATCS